jgi:glycosyltransferase involved in cell wall biosynthesis
MNIGINARYLQNPNSGIENYLLNLILSLKQVDTKNNYTLFFGKNPVPEQVLGSGFNCDVSRMPTHNQMLKILWGHLYLPGRIKKMKLDVFHEPCFIPPVFKKCPTVITVHDVSHRIVPHCFTLKNRLYIDMLLGKSLQAADSIITVSESSKNDIISNYKVSAKKIRVIYEGVNDRFRKKSNSEEIEDTKRFYNIKGNFILNISLITPRKNLVSLIRAFYLLKKSKKIDYQLVIVGRKGWLYDDIFKEVIKLKLEEDVVFCGHAPSEHLVHLYNAASAFVYPSLYEGFGLPILEAMACGCPVVTSNISSMPEVCGDAALLVNPKNIEEIAYAVNRVIVDTDLRRDLINKSSERIKFFSWQKAATETLSVYKEACLATRKFSSGEKL